MYQSSDSVPLGKLDLQFYTFVGIPAVLIFVKVCDKRVVKAQDY